jgi:hypothetical protein
MSTAADAFLTGFAESSSGVSTAKMAFFGAEAKKFPLFYRPKKAKKVDAGSEGSDLVASSLPLIQPGRMLFHAWPTCLFDGFHCGRILSAGFDGNWSAARIPASAEHRADHFGRSGVDRFRIHEAHTGPHSLPRSAGCAECRFSARLCADEPLPAEPGNDYYRAVSPSARNHGE